jgi:hypothetical protein
MPCSSTSNTAMTARSSAAASPRSLVATAYSRLRHPATTAFSASGIGTANASPSETIDTVASRCSTGARIGRWPRSSNLRLRHHLALIAPEPGRVTLTVGGEARTWTEGRCLVFDDSFVHEVHHAGERPLAVLSVDAWHPCLGDVDVRVLGDEVFQRFGRLRSE